MVNLRCLVLFTLLSFFCSKGVAQVFKPQQSKWLKPTADTLVLDSLSLMPGSVKYELYGNADTLGTPEINYQKHAIIFKGNKPDSILVSYTRLPYNLEKVYFHKDQTILYRDYSRPNNPFTITYNDANPQNNLFLNDGLTKNGNISRGISFGTSQDVVVNSNLNLQASGKLSPDVDIILAATDNNIPFQPDGTTTQLQEFDKVFVQLNTQNTKLIVGDYQLSRPQSAYFMNFYKRAQGAYFENTYKDSGFKNPLTFKTQFAGAVSKGKFSRQIFFGTESNQGPYRMKGADNEPFIIILSGTERIYIDGRLLQRGQENDYIIDYNTGEITFTARQIITKDKRIVAEFQYAERNYARSLFFFGEEITNKKTKIYLDFFTEQDNKNRPLQQTLTQTQKDILIDVGDSIQNAYYPGVQEQLYNTSDIFYKKIDSLVNGVLYPGIYVYSQDSANAKYNLKMSYLGPGKGNYNLFSSAANGRVFSWVAPVNGTLQGSYEPVITLVSPKQTQMFVAGFTHSITTNNNIGFEGVYTKNDINTFSSEAKNNDEAFGMKLVTRNQKLFGADTGRYTKLIYNGYYEFIQQPFNYIERFRTVEFDRDWNRPLNGKFLADQHIVTGDVGVVNEKATGLTYGLSYFNEGAVYRGLRQSAIGAFNLEKFQASYNGSYLVTQDTGLHQNTDFYRNKIQVAQRINKIRIAYSDVFEHNLFKSDTSGKLLPQAYQFWDWEGSVSNADSSKTKYKLFYRERRDKLAYGDALKDSTFAPSYGMQVTSNAIKNNPFTVLVTYRRLELSKNIVGDYLKPDNTLLNRLEYSPRYWKGFITGNLFYETGYGLDNKQEYSYLEVPPGQGQYTWKDYNGNTIKELNEFETAQFIDQANYIRIYTPTNEYVKILKNQFSISLSIRPSVLLKNSKSYLAKFTNLWAFQTAIRLDNKIQDSVILNAINPFYVANDSMLLSSSNSIRQSVLFNQSSAVFSADYTYIANQSKQLLTNGIENKTLLSQQVKWRYNFTPSWSFYNENTVSDKGNRSEFFSTRDYQIQAYESDVTLAFQPSTKFRLSGIYKYNYKINSLYQPETISGATDQKATLNTLGLELKYNQTEKGSLTGSFNFIRIDFNDSEYSSVAYEMMNGLNNGDNYTWELVYQRNLNNNIQLSFNYNGRRSPGTSVVNIGGAQIRAYF